MCTAQRLTTRRCPSTHTLDDTKSHRTAPPIQKSHRTGSYKQLPHSTNVSIATSHNTDSTTHRSIASDTTSHRGERTPCNLAAGMTSKHTPTAQSISTYRTTAWNATQHRPEPHTTTGVAARWSTTPTVNTWHRTPPTRPQGEFSGATSHRPDHAIHNTNARNETLQRIEFRKANVRTATVHVASFGSRLRPCSTMRTNGLPRQLRMCWTDERPHA